MKNPKRRGCQTNLSAPLTTLPHLNAASTRSVEFSVHPKLPQLEVTLHMFSADPLLKDILVFLDRDIEILHHCTLQTPVLACSLGYFNNPAYSEILSETRFRRSCFHGESLAASAGRTTPVVMTTSQVAPPDTRSSQTANVIETKPNCRSLTPATFTKCLHTLVSFQVRSPCGGTVFWVLKLDF